MTGPTLLQGQWEVLQTCCPFPWQGTPSPLGTSIGILTWGSGRCCRHAARSPWQGTPSPLGTSIGILTWQSSTAARGVPRAVASLGSSVASQERAGADSSSVPHLEDQEMAKPSGHVLAVSPAPEELCSERREAHPACSSQCPGTPQYPTQPPCWRG